MSEEESLFTLFRAQVEEIKPPERFTFPFRYVAHPLADIAARELQEYIEQLEEWKEREAVQASTSKPVGKMFGVLVVRNRHGKTGYLSAFSGKMGERNLVPGFVPPVYDRLQDDGFFKKEEQVLIDINKQIRRLQNEPAYQRALFELTETKELVDSQLARTKKQVKEAKEKRRLKREKSRDMLSNDAFCKLDEQLNNESKDDHFAFKRLKKDLKKKVERLQLEVEMFENEISALKKKRKRKSGELQQRLFDQYVFLNIDKKVKRLTDIFDKTIFHVPPSGAGDCAAPKLLQYAFQHDMQPLCMAEFWWGDPSPLEVRKHGHFYPACRSKCEPILQHMLDGMAVDPHPMYARASEEKKISVLYEDEYMLVINKPSGLLSVPGKVIKDSVAERMKQQYPEATGPLVAHRLDAETSGLMLIVKNTDVYRHLQKQFLEQGVKKTYVAVLNGLLSQDKGEISLPLRVDLNNRPCQMVCYQYGKEAITKWEVISRTDKMTIVRMYPLTGRTHQLRVHAAHSDGLDASIVGDELYGFKADRLHLHAMAISFLHPVTGKQLKFSDEPEFLARNIVS